MQNTFSQSGNDSKWFLTKIIFKIGMWHSRPPRDPSPFMANAILNFHFDFPHTSLSRTSAEVKSFHKKVKEKSCVNQQQRYYLICWFGFCGYLFYLSFVFFSGLSLSAQTTFGRIFNSDVSWEEDLQPTASANGLF